jgi:hypothetical protein
VFHEHVLNVVVDSPSKQAVICISRTRIELRGGLAVKTRISEKSHDEELPVNPAQSRMYMDT